MNFSEVVLYRDSNLKIMNRLFVILVLLVANAGWAQTSIKETELIRYDDYTFLAERVAPIRKDHLISLDQFNQYAQEPKTVILDTRSDSMYNAKHIKGAIHLNFSDFTAENLALLIPDHSTRILIYCNNNFMQNTLTSIQDMYFPSKVSYPLERSFQIQLDDDQPADNRSRRGYSSFLTPETPVTEEAKQYTLALNIPTFISLHGYGYGNVYELSDLVSTSDARIEFEGTAVVPNNLQMLPIISSPLVNFDDYMALMTEVEPHRAERLVSLDRFNELAAQPHTIILDFRSQAQYEAKHVKGAVHLDFTEFTQATLDSLIPDNSMNVLIYCNNNFLSDLKLYKEDYYFQSKKAEPYELNDYRKLTLALNVPAYINLYGYGFKNVYELAETVYVMDPRIQFEGTAVK